MPTISHRDQDIHKGAIEGDRPDDEQEFNAHAPAIDENGMPNDAVAMAEDEIGACEDKTQG